MDLTVVGCAGSLPGPESPASCYLVTASDGTRTWRVLLDLGSGAFGALQRYADPGALDAVVLSHLHPDHCLDLTALKVWRVHGPGGPGDDVPVYGPPGTAERTGRAYGVDKPSPMTGMDFRTLEDEQSFSVGPFTITPFRVRHPVTAFGLRVATEGAVLAYTGDTDSCPSLEPLMADADLVLAEASFIEGRDEARGLHLTGRRAAEAARAAGGVSRLMLTHIPPWNDPEVCRADAEEVWGPGVELATPGAVLVVGAPVDP